MVFYYRIFMASGKETETDTLITPLRGCFINAFVFILQRWRFVNLLLKCHVVCVALCVFCLQVCHP